MPTSHHHTATDHETSHGDFGLDQLLVEAANRNRRLLPSNDVAKIAYNLARKPRHTLELVTESARELTRVATGTSTAAPASGDRRFRDPAWDNWIFRRVKQGYLVLSDSARRAVDEAELDWAADKRVKVSLETLIESLAPTNFPLTNPEVLKATIDQGGHNFVKGAKQFLRDRQSPTKLPASVDPTPFKVGETLAASKGAVVERTERVELLQYAPLTKEVHKVPVLIVPPMISKFYVVDLAPGKSMVEYLSSKGLQPFAISWRNVGRRHADWDMDDYVQSIVHAIETVRKITRSKQVHLVGFCAGGIATTSAAAYLAAQGKMDYLASLNINVTVLDMEHGSPMMSFVSPELAQVATANIRRKGFLPGTDLAKTFAWLRPTDMIWNNFVNNYYLGKKPPALDLLYWNLDSMNMPAGLHADMMKIGLENSLARGELNILGTRINPAQITCDAYVAAGETDHLTPWPSCYQSSKLLGGNTRFVLSTGGHIAAVIHPEGSPKSSYWLNDNSAPDPDSWFESAEHLQGTWWEDWRAWLVERSGDTKAAPRRLGNTQFKPVCDAPGSYVMHKTSAHPTVN